MPLKVSCKVFGAEFSDTPMGGLARENHAPAAKVSGKVTGKVSQKVSALTVVRPLLDGVPD